MALTNGAKIVNRGPKDEDNGATIFVFVRKGNRKNIDLPIGSVVTVGEEVDAEEGQQLLSSTSWTFEEEKAVSKKKKAKNGEGEA